MSNSQNPTPHQRLSQMAGNVNAARTQRKVAMFSNTPLTPTSCMDTEERTFFDPTTGDVVTLQVGQYYLLACGCCCSNPKDIRGACPVCSKYNKGGWSRRTRLVCLRHRMCLRCRQKSLRRLRGGGTIRKTARVLFVLVLWPFFDVEVD